MKTGIFLTAEWRNLINITYEIAPALLLPYLPKGVELATINNKAHVSVVAFDFKNTKVKGVKIPFHVNFPEINLRFYVKYKGNIGVVFIREFVPKIAISKVAQWTYNEPYRSIPMKSSISIKDNIQTVIHRFHKDYSQKIEVSVDKSKGFIPSEDSLEHYFKEHELGFGTLKNGKTNVYRVEHPVWETYPITKINKQIDFKLLYGEKWAFLNEEKPLLQVFAEGSKIKVFENNLMENFRFS